MLTVLALIHAELGAAYPVAGGTARFPYFAVIFYYAVSLAMSSESIKQAVETEKAQIAADALPS